MTWRQTRTFCGVRRVVATAVGTAVVLSLLAPTALGAPYSFSKAFAEASAKKGKQKCKKGYKKVHVHGKVKCKKKKSGGQVGPTPTPTPTPGATADPRTRFLTMLNNSGWDRPFTADTPQHEPGEDLYNFCANGMFINRYTAPLSGTDYTSHGNWELVGEVKTGTILGYNVVEGHVVGPGTDQYGETKQFDLYIDLSEQAPNVAFINQNEFSRVTPQVC